MSVPTQPLFGMDPSPVPWTTLDEKMRAIVAIIVLVGFFGYLAMVTWHPALLPGDTLGIILGVLGTLAAGVVTFYFGTSFGSAVKDKTIAKQVDNNV